MKVDTEPGASPVKSGNLPGTPGGCSAQTWLMTPPTRAGRPLRLLAAALGVFVLLEVVAAAVCCVVVGWSWAEALEAFVLTNAAIGLSFGICGAILAWHRPHNPIPEVAVLVLTMFDDDDSVFAAMRAGARGYVVKGAEQEEIGRAIRAVASGEAIFGPGIAQRVLRFFATPAPAADPFPELTTREREILDLLAAAMPNSMIATRLGLSPKTVANHLSSIFTKLQVADRAQAILRARDAGLGSRPSPW